MLEKHSKSDVQAHCATCELEIFVPRNEWNRKLKHGIPRTYCSLSCAATRKRAAVLEERTCVCGVVFSAPLSSGKKTCSKHCAARRVQTPEMCAKRINTLRQLAKDRPEVWMKGLRAVKCRSSSKAERALADALKTLGYKRHKHITIGDRIIDVDIVSLDGKVWIESDGEWHFRQVHAEHNFEATRLRDLLEEKEAIVRGLLLIRVNNQTTTIEEQVAFIQKTVQSWTGSGEVMRFGY